MSIRIFSLLLTLLSFHSEAGINSSAEPFLKWGKTELTVCWLNQSDLPSRRLSSKQLQSIRPLMSSVSSIDTATKILIQKAVTSEFSIERTGVHFVGWKSCEETPSYDVFLLTGFGLPKGVPAGRSTLGYSDSASEYSRLSRGGVAFLYLNGTLTNAATMVSPRNYLKSLALHEFGHLAGLRHEHIREQAQNDPTCKFRTVLQEEPYQKTRFFSSYDPLSIMNYCFLDFTQGYSGLSFTTRSAVELQWNSDPYELFAEELHPLYREDASVVTFRSEDLKTHYDIRVGLSKKDVH